MATNDWLGLKQELPHNRRLILTVLSFVAPLVIWSAISYLPWLWHPSVRITDPGEVEYFAEGMEVPRGDFDKESAAMKKGGRTLPHGYPVNPVYLPPPHAVEKAFYTAFITPPRLPNEPWLHESLLHSIRTIFWGFVL